MAKVTFGKGRKGGGRLSVAQLKIQEGASKAIDGAESKVERFTRLLGNITRKNDIPSESKIAKAEEFIDKRVGKGGGGGGNNQLPGVFGTIFMLPFLLGKGSKTNEVDPETELRQNYGGDDELMKEKLSEEKKSRDEGKKVIDEQTKEDDKVASEKKLNIDKIKEPEQDQKETDDKKSEVEGKKDRLDTTELEEGKKEEDVKKEEEEEKANERNKKKRRKKEISGVEKLSEMVARFRKLVESGTPMAGVGQISRNKVLGGGIASSLMEGTKNVIRNIANFIMPKAAAATLSEQINPMAVKEVQLTDHTTTNNNEVTKTQVEPQETVMGESVKQEIEYDQDLPVEERKEIIYQMAVEAGAKFPEAVVAQYDLETTSGEDNIGTNNFFNLKAIEGQDYTERVVDEYINGEKVQMKDKFINFKTAQDAVDYLVKLWYKDYDGYTGVETDSEDVGEVADKLQSEQFATDPNYADKLKRIIRGNEPLIEKIKQGGGLVGGLVLSSFRNMMMKDEIEPIEDYTSTDKSGGGETIVLLNSNPSPNSLPPAPYVAPAGSGDEPPMTESSSPNEALTMLTLQALGGS